MARRRDFGSGFRARVDIEAIKGEKTINEFAPVVSLRLRFRSAQRPALTKRCNLHLEQGEKWS